MAFPLNLKLKKYITSPKFSLSMSANISKIKLSIHTAVLPFLSEWPWTAPLAACNTKTDRVKMATTERSEREKKKKH